MFVTLGELDGLREWFYCLAIDNDELQLDLVRRIMFLIFNEPIDEFGMPTEIVSRPHIFLDYSFCHISTDSNTKV